MTTLSISKPAKSVDTTALRERPLVALAINEGGMLVVPEQELIDGEYTVPYVLRHIRLEPTR